MFRLRVLPKRALLLEEGSVAKEVVIVLKGDIEIYRRLPNSIKPGKIEDQKFSINQTGPLDEGDEQLGELF